MVMVKNPKPYKWFIYGYGLVGQNIRPCTPLSIDDSHDSTHYARGILLYQKCAWLKGEIACALV